MTRPRFTVRWTMTLVALVALGLGGKMMLARWMDYRRLARYHSEMEARYRAEADAFRSDRSEAAQAVVMLAENLAAFHAPRRAKYERAAWRPWGRVEFVAGDDVSPFDPP